MGKVHVKHAGAWKEPTKLYVKRAGAWVEPLGGFVKTGGAWQRFYPGITPPDPTLTLDLDFTITTTLDPRVTFSRASLGTYFGADGLLKYAGHNWAKQSQTFDNATWAKVAGGTVTADMTTAPDGTTTADRINHVTAGSVVGGGVNQGALPNQFTDTLILSVYAKAGTKSFLNMTNAVDHANNSVFFNLATGTLGNKGSNHIAAGIEDAGGGWYRCWTKVLGNFFNGNINLRVAESGTTWICTSPGDIYLWGAQYENITFETTPRAYLPTTTAVAGAPRFDYHPVTHAPLGLLIEEARTNNAFNSQAFDNAGWTKTGCTVTADQAVAPDGTTTADLITTSASPATIGWATTSAGNYVVSVFVKRGTAGFLYMIGQATDSARAWFNLATGAAGTREAGILDSGVQDVGNGWLRCWMADAAGSGGEPTTFGLADADASTTVTIGRTVYLWGAQNEASGVFPTSYMPQSNAGGSNRAADVAIMTGTAFSSWYNQPAGTFVAEFDAFSVVGLHGVTTADNGSGSSSIKLDVNVTDPRALVSNVVVLDLGTFAPNAIAKSAIAYGATRQAGCFNGGTVQTAGALTVPSPVQFRIGNDVGNNYLSGHVRKIKYFNTVKSDADLVTLTTLDAALPVVTLAWTTPDDDTTPGFTVTFSGALAGDVLTLEVDDDYLFGSIFDSESVTLTAPMIAAGSVTMGSTISALSVGGTYYARVKVTR